MKIDLNKYSNALEEESFENLPFSYMSLESDESTNNPLEKTEWCFVRLYQTVYQKTLSAKQFLKMMNLFFSDKAIDGKDYTHANLNYRLTDNYFGLNIRNLNQENALYIESFDSIEETGVSEENSGYSVYGLRLTPLEYKNLKIQLEKMKEGNLYKYDILSLIQMAARISKNRIEAALKKGKFEKVDIEYGDIPLNRIKKGLVCSTFVAYCLKNISADYNKYMQETKKSIYEYAPNTLTKIPNMIHLFSGKFVNYKQDVKNFCKEHPEFAKYNK